MSYFNIFFVDHEAVKQKENNKSVMVFLLMLLLHDKATSRNRDIPADKKTGKSTASKSDFFVLYFLSLQKLEFATGGMTVLPYLSICGGLIALFGGKKRVPYASNKKENSFTFFNAVKASRKNPM